MLSTRASIGCYKAGAVLTTAAGTEECVTGFTPPRKADGVETIADGVDIPLLTAAGVI